MIPALLLLAGATLAVSGLSVFAQGQIAPLPAASPPSFVDGWPVLASTVVLGICGVLTAKINSGEREAKKQAEAEKKRADHAEDEVKEMIQKFEELSTEKRAVEKERDRLLRYAYSHGYVSSDEIPTRKDQP